MSVCSPIPGQVPPAPRRVCVCVGKLVANLLITSLPVVGASRTREPVFVCRTAELHDPWRSRIRKGGELLLVCAGVAGGVVPNLRSFG